MALAVLLGTAPARAAPSAELWPLWSKSSPDSATIVDHAPWNRLLGRYSVAGADGIDRFAYGRVTAADRAALATYLHRLAQVPVPSLNRAEQAAFWINLYNALTVQVVLAHYPVESIRAIAISPGLFSRGPWGKKLIAVDGTPVSLDDIEHRILRPIWRDPRIHYALNCAALGCPGLADTAYSSARLSVMLDRAARRFVNARRAVRVEDGHLMVSSIYVWFRSDFGGSDQRVIDHLRHYAAPALAAQLAGMHEIYDDHFDWRLNDAP